MQLITIDASLCQRDGICVAECPRLLLELREDSPVPVLVDGAADLCNRCGHCVAVCPQGALSHAELDSAWFVALRREWALPPERAEHFLRARRSIRSYRRETPDPELITRLISIARYSPTGTNSQQLRWLVINGRDEVEALVALTIPPMQRLLDDKHPLTAKLPLGAIVRAWRSGGDLIARGAPTLVCALAPRGSAMGQVECASALAYLDLAAPSLDLGCCWAGLFMLAITLAPSLEEALHLPDGYACFGVMMVGYPKFAYHRLPPRKKAVIGWIGTSPGAAGH